MSVWDTFSASFQLVQEKLEQVLDDSSTAAHEQQAVEGVDGGESGDVTSEQGPGSPSLPPGSGGKMEEREGGGGETVQQATALEAVEQQMVLIHDEYKKLLRDKEDELLQLKAVMQQEAQSSQPEVAGQLMRKELTVHKEMVAELRRQLTDKENEFQELNSRAEGKFNRLKTQAKTKIAALNKELERLREEHGAAPQLNISAQVLESSLLSTGDSATDQLLALQTELEERQRALEESKGEIERRKREAEERKREVEEGKREIEGRQKDLREVRRELGHVREEKESLLQQVDTLKDKLNVSEVCVGKEREERVRLDLRLTELEEDVETHASHMTSIKQAASQLQKSLAEEKAHSHCLWLQLQQDGGEGVSASPTAPGDELTPRTSVMAAGDKGSLVDMEQEILRLEASLREKDGQLSSFKSILEQTQAELGGAREHGEELATRLERVASEHSKEVETLSLELAELQTALDVSREKTRQLERDVERQGREGEEGREKVEREMEARKEELSAVSSLLEGQKQALQEAEEKLSERDAELVRVTAELQEVASANSALRGCLDGDRQSSAEQLASSQRQIQELQQTVSQLQAGLREKERETTELNLSRRELEESLGQVRENLQQSEATGQSDVESLSSKLSGLREDTREKVSRLEEALRIALSERDAEKSRAEKTREELGTINRTLAEVKREREGLAGDLEKVQSQLSKTSGALEFAEGQMKNKSGVIQNLSQLLEEKKSAVAELTAEVSSVRNDGATKLAELLCKNEELLKRNSALERDLSGKEAGLKEREVAVKELGRQSEKLKESLSLSEERLRLSSSQLEVVVRERESSRVEEEDLRGEVDTLSQSQTELEEKCREKKDMVAQLRAKLEESSSQVGELQKKLQAARQQVRKSGEELRECREREESLRSELERSGRENAQMKQQFDSAISLMETKEAEQSSLLHRTREDAESKETEILRLREQTTSGSRTIGELRERLTKSEANCKISSERCRLLERDGEQLRGRVGELEMAVNQGEAEVGDARAERESLSCEHQTLLSGIREHETRVLQLTHQVAELAREKEGLEMRVKESNRQLTASELGRDQLNSDLESLRLQLMESQQWQAEKKALLEAQSLVEQEMVRAQTGHSEARQQLQTAVADLQHQLQSTQLELEQRQTESSNSGEVERRLAEAEREHASQVLLLQQKLQEETEKREMAERSVQEVRAEVAIGMEDVQPPLPTTAPGQEKTLVDYMNTAVAWSQRLVRNPNIVLTRLLRATPQTKLFFLAYFILLHIVLLFILIL